MYGVNFDIQMLDVGAARVVRCVAFHRYNLKINARTSLLGHYEITVVLIALHRRPLFRYDESHRSHYAGASLSLVIGQVQKYLEEVDAGRYEIRFRDNEDPNKVRAKIIIGRDIDEAQRQALRRFNGHLHRIEVLTFDQLSRTAGQVISYLEKLVPH